MSLPGTLAIAVDNPAAYSQTFVRRHIASLNGGRTVVVQVRALRAPAADRPLLRLGTRNPLRLAGEAFARAFGLASPSARALRTFADAHGVGVLLAEFGHVGVRVHRAAAEAGIPMFCYFRGSDASLHLRNPRYVRQLRRMFPSLRGVVAVSDFLLRNLAAHGLEHPSSHVIPSGVDTQAFAPGAKVPGLVASVGRFVAKKRPELVLRAFALGAAGHPHARLEMVGDGRELAACRRLAADLGVSSRVAFHGARPHEFVRELLARAEVSLQHFMTAPDGDSEGMPSCVQEAMASGAVVVATRHAGVPEHVSDGVSGLLADEGDVDGQAAALGRVLGDAPLARSLAAAARAHAERALAHTLLLPRLEAILGQEAASA